MHHGKTRAMGWAVTALSGSIFLVACGGDAPAPGGESDSTPHSESSGTLTLKLSGAADVTGFQVEVKKPGGASVASKFLPTNGETASTFLALPAGSYDVTSTPMRSPSEPHPDCKAASQRVRIKAGKTSEVTLLSQCQSPSAGGLAVGVGADFAPQLLSVTVDPGTKVAACDPVTVTLLASAPDGTALSCAATLGAGAKLNGTPTPSAEPNTIACSFKLEPSAGEQTLTVEACSATQCATLDVPLHVTASACTPTCDDENPCTTDVRSPEGFCSSTPAADGKLCSGGNFKAKLLGFNDFHGQLEKGKLVAGRPVGGAEVLASYLRTAQAGIEDQTIIVHAGDHLGASPPASALLQDEPSIQFLNLLANASCTYGDKLNPACNLVGTLGNHEFDEGLAELLRMLNGGNFATGPFLEDPYAGARFPYVSSNVVDHASGQPLLRPFVVKQLHGVKLGFIGAVLKQTPTIVTPTGVAGLDFLDEADAINAQVAALQTLGVHTHIVTIHQGGFQSSYTGPTRAASALSSGPEILDIVKRLDDDVDVVISGHSHAFTNAYIPNAHGKQILVVQAFSASTAYDDVDLLIDPVSGDVVSKTAQVVTTFGDVGPGLVAEPDVAAVVKAASDRVAPLVSQVFGTTPSALTRNQNAAGESQLGDLIADSQRAAQDAQFVFMNPGGIRADLDAGDITFGDLFTIQPFGNTLVHLDMTGAQIIQALEQQWLGQSSPKILQISGFEYTWNPAAPIGSRIVEVRLGGVAIDPTASYSVTCNNFLATGGDGFTAFKSGSNQVGGPVDLDVMIEYVRDLNDVGVPVGGRIKTL